MVEKCHLSAYTAYRGGHHEPPLREEARPFERPRVSHVGVNEVLRTEVVQVAIGVDQQPEIAPIGGLDHVPVEIPEVPYRPDWDTEDGDESFPVELTEPRFRRKPQIAAPKIHRARWLDVLSAHVLELEHPEASAPQVTRRRTACGPDQRRSVDGRRDRIRRARKTHVPRR